MTTTAGRRRVTDIGPRGTWVALGLVIAVHIGLVIVVTSQRGMLWHDEAISVLSSTAHQADWHEIEQSKTPPYGTWVPASEFQRLMVVDQPFNLSAVSAGLGEYEHHPPLFYWLHHLALLAGLPVLWAGPVVNMAAAVGLALAVMALTRFLLGSSIVGVAVVAAVLWSPSFVWSGAEALLYPLFALMAVCLAFVSARIVAARGPTQPTRWLLGLAAVCFLAPLTHHQFMLLCVIAAAGIAILGPQDGRRRLAVVGAAAGGIVAAFAVFPYFFRHTSELPSASAAIQPELILGRLSRWLTWAFDTVTPDRSFSWLTRPIALIATTVIIGLLLLKARQVVRWVRSNAAQAIVIGLAIVAMAIPALSYALQRAPEHAVGTRYVVGPWPLVALSLTLIAAALWRRGLTVAVALAALTLTSSITATVSAIDSARAGREVRETLSRADVVITDCASRGYFLTVAPLLRPETPVFLATGRDLVRALDDGTVRPEGTVAFLSSRCPDSGDVTGALARNGIDPGGTVGLWRYALFVWNSEG